MSVLLHWDQGVTVRLRCRGSARRAVGRTGSVEAWLVRAALGEHASVREHVMRAIKRTLAAQNVRRGSRRPLGELVSQRLRARLPGAIARAGHAIGSAVARGAAFDERSSVPRRGGAVRRSRLPRGRPFGRADHASSPAAARAARAHGHAGAPDQRQGWPACSSAPLGHALLSDPRPLVRRAPRARPGRRRDRPGPRGRSGPPPSTQQRPTLLVSFELRARQR